MVQSVFFLPVKIHILNDPTRGSTVEAVITRMKTIQAARTRGNVDTGLPPLRLVAVSATITNIEDVRSCFLYLTLAKLQISTFFLTKTY